MGMAPQEKANKKDPLLEKPWFSVFAERLRMRGPGGGWGGGG